MRAHDVSGPALLLGSQMRPTEPAVLHLVAQDGPHRVAHLIVGRSLDHFSEEGSAERLGHARHRDDLVEHPLAWREACRSDRDGPSWRDLRGLSPKMSDQIAAKRS